MGTSGKGLEATPGLVQMAERLVKKKLGFCRSFHDEAIWENSQPWNLERSNIGEFTYGQPLPVAEWSGAEFIHLLNCFAQECAFLECSQTRLWWSIWSLPFRTNSAFFCISHTKRHMFYFLPQDHSWNFFKKAAHRQSKFIILILFLKFTFYLFLIQ